jgi:hypothetical protein
MSYLIVMSEDPNQSEIVTPATLNYFSLRSCGSHLLRLRRSAQRMVVTALYLVLGPKISFRTSRISQLQLLLVVMMIALINLTSSAISLGTMCRRSMQVQDWLSVLLSMAGPGSHRAG